MLKEQASISLGNLTRDIMKEIGITTMDYSPIIKLANLGGENFINYKVSLSAIQRFLPNLNENSINKFIEINEYFINAENDEPDELKRFDFVLFTSGLLGSKETRGRNSLDEGNKKVAVRVYVEQKYLDGKDISVIKNEIINLIKNGK